MVTCVGRVMLIGVFLFFLGFFGRGDCLFRGGIRSVVGL